MPKGILIAGTHSGVGKTTITLALLAALRRRGLAVAPFKVGPDFIDPGHHRAAAGRESRNLDGWMLGHETCRAIFARAAKPSDFAVVEGVMGLFDGAAGDREDGSSAEMAKWLGLPVVLVVDAQAMARSAAAVVKGFADFDRDLRLRGVIFNRIGGVGHLEYLREAMRAVPQVEVLGGLFSDPHIHLPERHLGLVTADERAPDPDMLARMADWLEGGVRLDRLMAIASEMPLIAPNPAWEQPSLTAFSRRLRIAIARDEAFCFYYPDNLELLERLGVTTASFSPLVDSALPDRCDLVYLGGGYPELHAAALSSNDAMQESLRAYTARGGFIYAECGGFMYLCRQLVDLEGRAHRMAGLFPFSTRMEPKLSALGYREAEALPGNPLFEPGSTLRGHVFHYSSLDTGVEAPAPEVRATFRVSSARGPSAESEGYCTNTRTLGGYLHLHFLSNPAALAAALRRVAESDSNAATG